MEVKQIPNSVPKTSRTLDETTLVVETSDELAVKFHFAMTYGTMFRADG